jgi:outer membrane lipoprotein-sorting protein/DNA-binding CsgD family transcriptional regulator
MDRGRPRYDDILTPREWEVLALIEAGLTNEEIAARLGISFGTAKYHVAEIISKLGAASREDAVAAARRRAARALAPLPFGLAPRAMRLVAGGAVAGAAAVLVLLAVLAWPGSSASPVEDLPEAAADFPSGPAASQPSAGSRENVRSMAITMVSSSYLLSGDHRGDLGEEWTFKLWYQTPQRMRLEAGGGSLSVWDGTDFWRYDPKRNGASVVRQDPDRDIFSHAHAYMVQWVDDIDAYIQDALPCRTARLTGDEPVAGRDAFVLELGRMRCGIVYPGSDGKRILWVDKETGLLLKSEQYSLDGQLAYSSEVLGIDYNLPIDEGRFSFTPPPDAEVEDDRDQPLGVLYSADTPAPEYLSLDAAQEAATFPVLTPTFVPQGFELESVEHHWASDFARQNRSHADWVLLRYADAEGNWLQIGQGFPGSYVAIAADPPQGRSGTMEVDGVEATWIDGWPLSDEVWQPGVRTALYWDAGRLGNGREVSPDGTVSTGSPLSIGLSSNVLALEELAAVAGSLE